MARTYPRPALAGTPRQNRWRQRSAVLAAAGGSLLALPLAAGPRAWSGDLFTAQAVDASRFAVLARPIGRDDWNLLVLEQLAAQPRCWLERPDGLIDPSLNRFNFSGICSRYLDSNGYSVRLGGQDLASSFRLRLLQVGEELQLRASSVATPNDLLVGRGRVPRRDRDGFVAVQLEPDWSLQRRAFQGRALGHLYFAHRDSLSVLLAKQQPPAPPGLAGAEPLAPNPPGRRRPAADSQPTAGGSALGTLAAADPAVPTGRPIPLPVIPFRE
ncbi:MAG: DUF3747 domain-containing protein [Synechococcus sp.]|nr:DUF3747 domain-containing protein [Synechococcus sp.]